MTHYPPCVGVYVFGSRGTGFLSNCIVTVTRPKGWESDDTPTHAGMIFEYADGSVDYAEAFLGEDWATGLSIARLKKYDRESGQWVRGFKLPLTEGECAMVRATAEAKVTRWHYSVGQLLRILRHRLTRGLWPIPKTPNLVCCSEAVARIVHGVYPMEAASGRETVEDIAPVDLFVAARNKQLDIICLPAIISDIKRRHP